MKIILLLLVVMVGGSAFWFMRSKSQSAKSVAVREIQYGPFTIKMETLSSRYFNMNYGKMSTHTTVSYSVWYQGKLVPFPGQLQENTGFSHVWRVYILEGAPSPTLMAGSQSLYLICEANGALKVDPLYVQSQDFAKFQLLDAENGQPSPTQSVYMASEGDGVDTLKGGDLLLVGMEKVLRLSDLRLFPIDNPGFEVDNYCYHGDKGAIGLSPDKESIVYLGDFQTWKTNDTPAYHRALVIFNYKKSTGYTLPLDRTALRLHDPAALDHPWLSRFFTWTHEAGKPDMLRPKKLEHPPLWTGFFTSDSTYYHLHPAKEALLPVFLEFVITQFGAVQGDIKGDKYHEYTGRVIDIEKDGRKITVTYKSDIPEITLSSNLYLDDRQPSNVVVQQIGAAFNAELAQGKYQDLFGRIREE